MPRLPFLSVRFDGFIDIVVGLVALTVVLVYYSIRARLTLLPPLYSSAAVPRWPAACLVTTVTTQFFDPRLRHAHCGRPSFLRGYTHRFGRAHPVHG